MRSELGVRSTPTFFINGLAVVGAQPFEVFERVIDMELAGEIPEYPDTRKLVLQRIRNHEAQHE